MFVDLDTVLLAIHQGRRGVELGLQADIEEGIDRLAEFAVFIVVLAEPPQPDARHGLETESRLDVLREGLGETGNQLLIVTCPHGEGEACSCAKPDSGLIHLAADEHGVSLRGGWYIGGDQEGVVAGRQAGLHTIRLGPAGEDHLSNVHRPDYEARDLLDAANHIMLEELAR